MSFLVNRNLFKIVFSSKLRQVRNSNNFSNSRSNKKDQKFYEKCFRTLELDPDSNQDQVRCQYIRLVKKFHPDSDTSKSDNLNMDTSKLDTSKLDNLKTDTSKMDISKSDISISKMDLESRLKEFYKIDEVNKFNDNTIINVSGKIPTNNDYYFTYRNKLIFRKIKNSDH